jgi:solute:Na+ symporter, SSS family
MFRFALLLIAVVCSYPTPSHAAPALVESRAGEATRAEWEAARARPEATGRFGAEFARVEGSAGPILVVETTAGAARRHPLPQALGRAVVSRAGATSWLVAGIAPASGGEPAGFAATLVILSYNEVTDRWAELARRGTPPSATLAWENATTLLIEEDAAAAHVRREALSAPEPRARSLDLVVVGLYLAAMLGIGLFFSRGRSTGTADYFLADRELNWFVGGVTLYATATSAISFVSIPAKAFTSNWQYMASNYVTLIGTVIAAFVLIPRLRRMNLVSVYSYLETRFHPSLRIFGSGVTIIFNLVGKQSVVIALPALVLQQMLGLDLLWGVFLIGAVTTAYTLVGGFRAVVWTDLAQCFLMLGGAIYAVIWIMQLVGGEPAALWREASELGKTQIFSFDLSLVAPTLWAFLFLEVFNILTWPKDQMLMQRVFATRNEAHARGSVIFMAFLVIPGATTFFAIGTALFLFYREHPERFLPGIANDAVFPMFIAWEMPAGLSGLLIAAILAASMSTLSSGLSSLATLMRVDFLDRFAVFSGVRDRVSNRALVLGTGVVATAAGAVVSLFGIQSLLDFGLQAFAVLGGGFAAAYGLGLFTRSARWDGVLIGTAVSAIASFFLVQHVSPILMQATTVGISLVVGYIASVILNLIRPLAPR